MKQHSLGERNTNQEKLLKKRLKEAVWRAVQFWLSDGLDIVAVLQPTIPTERTKNGNDFIASTPDEREK